MNKDEKILKIEELPDIFYESDAFLLDIDYRRKHIDGELQAELHLYLRCQSRRYRIKLHDILPYFYVQTDENQIQVLLSEKTIFSNWFLEMEEVEKFKYNGREKTNVTKIYGKRPWQVPEIRQIFSLYNINYYEADIPFTHRFLIDYKIFGLKSIRFIPQNQTEYKLVSEEKSLTPKIMSLDIEIDSSEDSDEPQESLASILQAGNKSITAISLWWGYNSDDEHSKVFVLESDDKADERQFLKDAISYIWNDIDPDVIVTYNGDRFDFPYMIKRMEVIGLSTSLLSPYGDTTPREPKYGNGWIIPGVMVYDLFRRTTWIYTADGKKSLDSVAEQLLGKKKLELPVDHGEIWQRARRNAKDMELFRSYALRDAELTYKLFFAMNMAEWLEVIMITGAPPAEAMYFTERQNGEFLVLRLMYQHDILIPPTPTPEERKLRKKHRISAKGGLVLEPKRAIATSVLICDFTSMYPSIMAAHNVGAESFVGTDKPIKKRFKQHPKTTMAMMQEMMLDRRVRVKAKLRSEDISKHEKEGLLRLNQALKIVANSTFGSYNFIGSRFYNTKIASTITGIGRNYLREVSKKVKAFKEGYETIYGDTDSVFIETPLDDKIAKLWKMDTGQEEGLEKIDEINSLLSYLQETLPKEMRLVLEDIAYRILFHEGAKKRYTYVSAITGRISIVGLEAVRNDWAPFSKNIQKYAIEIILTTGDLALAKNQIIKFIREQINVEDEELIEKVTTTGPIKRQPRKYKSITPAVAAFEHYAKKEKMDPTQAWKYYDYFPYVIVRGDGSLRNRARHPKFVKAKYVDIDHYISRALAAINRFNVNISLEEVNEYLYHTLDEFF